MNVLDACSPHWIRDRRAGWYSSSVYFVHKVSEEAAIIVLMTLPLSCILFFPLELHGDWSLFWLVQVTTTSIGTRESLTFARRLFLLWALRDQQRWSCSWSHHADPAVRWCIDRTLVDLQCWCTRSRR